MYGQTQIYLYQHLCKQFYYKGEMILQYIYTNKFYRKLSFMNRISPLYQQDLTYIHLMTALGRYMGDLRTWLQHPIVYGSQWYQFKRGNVIDRQMFHLFSSLIIIPFSGRFYFQYPLNLKWMSLEIINI